MAFLDAVAKALPRLGDDLLPAAGGATPTGSTRPAGAPKPVLQFAPFPVTLDIARYENAQSNSNPNGDLRPLFEFRSLVDPAPGFARFYSPSGVSTEQTYETILNGAVVTTGNSFATALVSKAKKQFAEKSFAQMDGTPGVWRPVYAVPADWCDLSKLGRFQELNIDLSDQGDSAPYSMIGGSAALQLSIAGHSTEGKTLDLRTTLRSLRMKYMLVSFQRPWLNPLLFQSAGWYLSQQARGFCSSGDIDSNSGVLPLLTTAILLAKDVSIDAAWAREDRAFIDSAKSSRTAVSLGPFSVDRELPDSNVNLIGWISSLVPYSPKDSDLRSGSVLVTNRGAFISRFSAAWSQNGQGVTAESGLFPALAAKSIGIPAEAKAISINIEVMTFPQPVETWKTVATLEFDEPVRKCFELAGTTMNAQFREVTCNS
jgi:hypothetical protein